MKIYYYTILSAILMILFYIVGIDTTSSFIFERFSVLDIGNVQNSSFFLLLGGLFSLITGGMILIGSYTNVSPQYILKSIVIIPVLILMIGDLVSIIYLVEGWARWLLSLIIIPFVVGYAAVILEFWEARD